MSGLQAVTGERNNGLSIALANLSNTLDRRNPRGDAPQYVTDEYVTVTTETPAGVDTHTFRVSVGATITIMAKIDFAIRHQAAPSAPVPTPATTPE